MAPRRPSPASADRRTQEDALFERLQRERTPAARDAIVDRFMPLARQIARRYSRGRDLDDLEQVAAIGLMKAIDRFEPERGLAFSSFAVPTIAGEVKRYLRDHAWMVRVPRELQETHVRAGSATAALTTELGRVPTAAELAERIGSTVELVLEARQMVTARRPISLDQPATEADETETLGTRLGTDEPGFETAEQSALLDTLLLELSERDERILRLRFADDLTQIEIGARVGLSQVQVSRAIRQALAQLQETATTNV